MRITLVDESPYGVRGAAGNVADWCADSYRKEGPDWPGGRVVIPQVPDGPVDMSIASRRSFRGGFWVGTAGLSRCAFRSGGEPTARHATLGFRLARSLPQT